MLRPNLLSLYRSSTEERLLKQITLSDLTAVGYLKDPKGRRQHVFGLFSPSRNFHLQAKSDAEARAWVELIKKEARIDEDSVSFPASLTARDPHFEHSGHDQWEQDFRAASSSPEPWEALPRPSITKDGIKIPGIRRPSAQHELEYSGDEMAHFSDFSDTPSHNYNQPGSHKSFVQRGQRAASTDHTPYKQHHQADAARNASQVSGFHADQGDERVIWNDYLLCLKSKGGVKQWKRLWVVLRQKNLALYKNNEVADNFADFACYTNPDGRSMRHISSFPCPTSSVPSRLIPSLEANPIACKLSLRTGATAFVHQAKTR